MNPELRREIRDLGLVGGGAIPGALLRWKLETIGHTLSGGLLRGAISADFLANMLGCLLIGLVIAQGPARTRLILAVGIGFCGSLTTFSSWMLELAKALRAGESLGALSVLLLSLIGGLVLVSAGYAIGQGLQRRRAG